MDAITVSFSKIRALFLIFKKEQGRPPNLTPSSPLSPLPPSPLPPPPSCASDFDIKIG